jgi:bacteriocin-like protein
MKKEKEKKGADSEKKAKNPGKKELNKEDLDKVSGGFPGAPKPEHYTQK